MVTESDIQALRAMLESLIKGEFSEQLKGIGYLIAIMGFSLEIVLITIWFRLGDILKTLKKGKE